MLNFLYALKHLSKEKYRHQLNVFVSTYTNSWYYIGNKPATSKFFNILEKRFLIRSIICTVALSFTVYYFD